VCVWKVRLEGCCMARSHCLLPTKLVPSVEEWVDKSGLGLRKSCIICPRLSFYCLRQIAGWSEHWRERRVRPSTTQIL